VTLTVGSLFSGIGGIDLGLERAGMTVKWQSEIDPFACKVLKKHWPDIPNLGDIKEIDWSKVEPVDLIAGGYPCQPFSTAGKRQGENDPRHLWPYFRTPLAQFDHNLHCWKMYGVISLWGLNNRRWRPCPNRV
jgi:DNA (cytosine-5)-methyltransferase 1